MRILKILIFIGSLSYNKSIIYLHQKSTKILLQESFCKGRPIMSYRRRRTKTEKTESQKMGKIKHKKTEVDGIIFDSKMESQYYEYLKMEMNAGRVKEFSLQPEFILQEKFIVVEGEVIYGNDPKFNKIKRKTKAPTVQAIKYISDFKVEYPNGTVVIVDTKGQETADFKIKKKMFTLRYPELTLKVIILDKADGWIDYDAYKKKARERLKQKKLKAEDNK